MAAGRPKTLRVSRRRQRARDPRRRRRSRRCEGITATFATPRGEIDDRGEAADRPLQRREPRARGRHRRGARASSHDGDRARASRSSRGVPGRVERVANTADLDIFVDYAHTPDALRNVLAALRPLTKRRLICVFGCGGDRDPTKRPKMGAAVAELADLAVVTSDNPRTEDPRAIIDQILPAVPRAVLRRCRSPGRDPRRDRRGDARRRRRDRRQGPRGLPDPRHDEDPLRRPRGGRGRRRASASIRLLVGLARDAGGDAPRRRQRDGSIAS